MRAKEKGNVLFLILIAVAMFAALSYAVTRSGRGGGGIGREQNMLKASLILQQSAALKTAVDRMILSGTPAEDIVFTTAWCAAPGTGNECTSGADCLFAPEGGGATPVSLPANIASGVGPMEECYTLAGHGWTVQDVGTAAPDIMYSIDLVSEDICRAINAQIGIPGIPKDIQNGDNNISDGNVLDGRVVMCHEQPHNTTYSYVHVLVER